MRKFHNQGVRTVIFSSTELNSEFLVALASSRGPEGEDSTAYEINIPKFPAAFVGTGKNVCEVFDKQANMDFSSCKVTFSRPCPLLG